jgi:hypothetical protein
MNSTKLFLDIPDLPEHAFKHYGDRKIKPQGDDGGGGAAQPSTTTQKQDLPDWAIPYAQEVLGKGSALASAPYQAYTGERIAQFTPMQQQAFQGASKMGPSAATGQAVNKALNTSYDPYATGQFGAQANQYMDPYMQNVVGIQQREAARASEMQRNQNQAGAVQSGAFGGSRQAIMEAERQRNLATQQGDIQARGLQDAYSRGQNQFNTEQQLREQSKQYGAGLGLQGLQTALTGAGQQFQQGMDVNKLQAGYGTQQQQQVQNILGQQYQDFLDQKKFPYQQLEFQSNLLRGTPSGTTQSMYSAGPTAAQQVGTLGMGAYGISQLMGKAAGGSVSSYADGGSVDSAQNIEAIVDRLSDVQLKQAAEAAQARGDVEQLQIIQSEMAMRASERSGMAGAFNQLPQEQQQQMMAGGGIVAFSGDEDENENGLGQLVGGMMPSEGNPEVYKKLTGYFPQLLANVAKSKYTPMTDDKYNEAITKRREMLEEGAGTSPYADIKGKIAAMRGEDEQALSQGRGLAALQAAAAMSQGSGFIQGLGRAGGAFAESYGKALQADKAQKRSLMSMEMNAADAMRKERMGLNRDAISAADQARKDHDAAQQYGVRKANALANVAGKFAAATKPTKAAGSGGPKPLKIAEQLAAAEIEHETNPSDASLNRVTALRRAVAQTKTSDYGPVRAGQVDAGLDVKLGEAINTAQQKLKFTPEYVKADKATKERMLRDTAAEVRANASRATPVNNNSPRVGQNDYSSLWGGNN